MIENIKDLYSYQDGNLFRLQASGGQKIGSVAGWETICNGKKYKKINIKNKTYYLHQAIFFYHYGYIPKYIDHADGNSLNNKIENLREATQSQNAHNAPKRKTNKSGYKGVCLVKNKWRSVIMVNGKNIYLGVYDSIEDAAIAYKNGANKFYGQFAKS